MTSIEDPRVDAFINALPIWQQAICREVRELVHAADPEVAETIKRTNQPYFVLQGNICALLAAKDHVNIFLNDGAIVPDPKGIITGGHDNSTARTVAVRQGETINRAALTASREATQLPRSNLAEPPGPPKCRIYSGCTLVIYPLTLLSQSSCIIFGVG